MKLAILFASLTACVPLASDDPASPDPAQPAVDPVPDGTYSLRSEYDVTAEAVLPEPAYELVITLRSFSTAPGATLLDVAEDAGVPAVGTIRDALPSTLENKLVGWIDDQLAKLTIDGVPVTQIANELAALAETVLTRFAIDSELTIDGTTATHRLERIDFAPAGVDVSLSLADLPSELSTRTASCTVDHATLSIGDHGYGLPFGLHAWAAFETAVVDRFGKSPRALLGDAIDCPAVADAVAGKCVLALCVGHRAELTAICERGLDEVVGAVQRRIEGLAFEAIHLQQGRATLVDADRDGRFDTIPGGTWTAQIDASQGLRPVPATFATRP